MADRIDRKYTIKAKIEECEIRKVNDVDASFEKENGEKVESHYIELWCDVGEDNERIYLKDRDMSHLDKYKRGQVGTFTVRIDVDEGFKGKTKITVIEFKENKKGGK